MDALQFAYWLQGYSELGGDTPTAQQWAAIKGHLALVFKKVTPPVQAAPSDLLRRLAEQQIPQRAPVINPFINPPASNPYPQPPPWWANQPQCPAGGANSQPYC
jgi:hypothetical protein